MKAFLPGATRAEAVYRSWVEDPDLDPWQTTHAVPGGEAVTLCGVTVGAQGGPWPQFSTAWESKVARCAVCAQHVYGGAARE